MPESTPSPAVEFIDRTQDLLALADRIQGNPWLAMDTEFIRTQTFFPKLCLVQVATNDVLACIDPLAIADLTPLVPVLCDPQTVKVLHAAEQDIEAIVHQLGLAPTPVFDTQLAAAVLGHGDQPGYARLVQHFTGVVLDKSQTRTDWSQRPLLPEQVAYAADDVRYLGEIYRILAAQLCSRGRLDWLRNDFHTLSQLTHYQPNPETAWRRISGLNGFRPQQLAVVHALAAWRERTAIALNLPRKRVMSDEVLIVLARHPPRSIQQLNRQSGLGESTRSCHGEQILAVVDQALQSPATSWPASKPYSPPAADTEILTDAAMAILRLCAKTHDLTPRMLASRRQIERLIQGERNIALLNGWRYHVAGRTLERFLRGELTLSIQRGQARLHEQTSATHHKISE